MLLDKVTVAGRSDLPMRSAAWPATGNIGKTIAKCRSRCTITSLPAAVQHPFDNEGVNESLNGEFRGDNIRDRRLLELADGVDEEAMVIRRQVSQIVGIISEVIANTDFEVLAHLAVDGGNKAKIRALAGVLP